jgi:CRISPR-associated protein Cmr4
MKTELYKITTLSNLHVGSGDINFDVIDNQVQRDATTKLPNINSSSLKGAFREHFTKDGESNMVKYIFGGANSENDAQAGAYSFFEANLLTRPVRSNVKPYFNATCPSVIKNLLDTVDTFGVDFDEELKSELKKLSALTPSKPMIFEDIKNAILEDEKAEYKNFGTSKLISFLGENIALFSDKDFAELDLPVLARNALENGVSTNLWYEEVVPKQSKFTFIITKPTNIDAKDKDQKIDGFENRFDNEGELIQIGANKSIGYGYSKIVKVSK